MDNLLALNNGVKKFFHETLARARRQKLHRKRMRVLSQGGQKISAAIIDL
jgi:hypothetical protein